MYVPTLIFGHLLTSSNYDDTEKKVTGRTLLTWFCFHFVVLISNVQVLNHTG